MKDSLSSTSGCVCLMVPAEPMIQHLCLRILFVFLVYHSLVPILEGLVWVSTWACPLPRAWRPKHVPWWPRAPSFDHHFLRLPLLVLVCVWRGILGTVPALGSLLPGEEAESKQVFSVGGGVGIGEEHPRSGWLAGPAGVWSWSGSHSSLCFPLKAVLLEPASC